MKITKALFQRLLVHTAIAALGIAIAAVVVVYIYNQWQKQTASNQQTTEGESASPMQGGTMPARLNAEARKNLGVITQAMHPTQYYRRIEIPGIVVDRPGVSDRGVAAPIAGVIAKIHAYPGSAVLPNSPLFTLRLVSDSIHNSQLELFKAMREIEIARNQKQRLDGLASSGGVPGSRIIELDNEIQRMEVNVLAFRQNLSARGLSDDQINAAAQGTFVTEITVSAPRVLPRASSDVLNSSGDVEDTSQDAFTFELHSLNVTLGQQVDAGTVLCVLADHRELMIEGRGFKKDLTAIQRAAIEQLPIDVVFESNDAEHWQQPSHHFSIEHIGNSIDPSTRTFAFFMPLENQWDSFPQNEQRRLIWRFRPGDRVRIFVAVESLDNVIVLPTAAVVRDGAEAFVFRQNGDLFDRIGVHVIYEDSQSVVIANDEKLRRTSYIAQNAAASLNRILKAQMSSGQPTNLHVHADGTVHAAH